MPHVRTAALLVVLATLLALAAPVRLVWDWYRVARIAPAALPANTVRGFDWVHWEDRSGQVVAAYVFPRGPAAAAGVAEGDTFLSVEGAMLFDAANVSSTVAAMPPGQLARVEVRHADRPETRTVALTRYPTFLYPRSEALWAFSLWGFVVAAFLHGVGLALASPLAASGSSAGRYVRRLVMVSALWIFPTLARLLLVEIVGPPGRVGGPYDAAMQALTFAGLAGWIAFPAVLVGNVLHRTRLRTLRPLDRLRLVRWLPALVLGGVAGVATVRGGFGPIGLDTLVAPILVHATVFIALAAALPLVVAERGAERLPGGFSRVGSLLTLLAALALTAALLGVGPLARASAGTRAWVVVAAQLLSVAPGMLVAQATLRFGKRDAVLTRAATGFVAAGAFFFAFVGVMYLLRQGIGARQPSWPLVAALVGVVLFAVLHRVLLRLWEAPPAWLVTERQRARARIVHFQEQVPLVMDPDALAADALRLACEASGARSGVLFYRGPEGPEPRPDAPADLLEAGWRAAHYHPEPPYLTAPMAARIWPHLRSDGRVWARRAELREQVLPPEHARLLESVGADVALPVVAEGAPLGMLLLAGKHDRLRVFNLDDLELLRLVASAFALGLERLDRIEREKVLARKSTEAQLVALRAQINPHFLFNALNTIAALIAERPDEAESAVEHLAKIFRHTLTTAAAPTVPLSAELDLVGRYLAIEQMRFGDRLRVEIDVPDDLRAHPVPAFALQTLVENAVKHGLEPRRGKVRLALRARRAEDRDDGAEAEADRGALVLVVEDSGVGVRGQDLPGPVDPSTYGIGLSNVAARLADLYGRADLLRLDSRPGAGTTATLRLPEGP